MKFTTYIKKTTHIGVKTRLVSKEKELSDLVEELLSNWLKKMSRSRHKPDLAQGALMRPGELRTP